MTNEELLLIIKDALFHSEVGEKFQSALRAVVELHKPIKDEWFNIDEIICEKCTREEYTQKYPCPTIQAIEKELS